MGPEKRRLCSQLAAALASVCTRGCSDPRSRGCHPREGLHSSRHGPARRKVKGRAARRSRDPAPLSDTCPRCAATGRREAVTSVALGAPAPWGPAQEGRRKETCVGIQPCLPHTLLLKPPHQRKRFFALLCGDGTTGVALLPQRPPGPQAPQCPSLRAPTCPRSPCLSTQDPRAALEVGPTPAPEADGVKDSVCVAPRGT